MDGEKIHFSSHGAARMNQLYVMPVSRYVDVVYHEKSGGDATYRNALCLSLLMIFDDPVVDKSGNTGASVRC